MRRLLIVALSCGSAAAQLSGSYLVDPAGGPSVFASITAAMNAALINGVAGPVEFLIVPGVYQESVLVPPIAGMSPANRVTLRSLQGSGTVHLQGTTTPRASP